MNWKEYPRCIIPFWLFSNHWEKYKYMFYWWKKYRWVPDECGRIAGEQSSDLSVWIERCWLAGRLIENRKPSQFDGQWSLMVERHAFSGYTRRRAVSALLPPSLPLSMFPTNTTGIHARVRQKKREHGTPSRQCSSAVGCRLCRLRAALGGRKVSETSNAVAKN